MIMIDELALMVIEPDIEPICANDDVLVNVSVVCIDFNTFDTTSVPVTFDVVLLPLNKILLFVTTTEIPPLPLKIDVSKLITAWLPDVIVWNPNPPLTVVTPTKPGVGCTRWYEYVLRDRVASKLDMGQHRYRNMCDGILPLNYMQCNMCYVVVPLAQWLTTY
jgi:hypothetical protein